MKGLVSTRADSNLQSIVQEAKPLTATLYTSVTLSFYNDEDDSEVSKYVLHIRRSLAKMSDWASKWDLRINYDRSLFMSADKGSVAESVWM
ncbi:hypothetical protein RB195_011815 [Necator americanus]|uniref:Uncharacterized protein n=1 Tax=Necator americanus TaxID=51031 RepID=A0ABR1D532_NECAM